MLACVTAQRLGRVEEHSHGLRSQLTRPDALDNITG